MVNVLLMKYTVCEEYVKWKYCLRDMFKFDMLNDKIVILYI